MKALPGKVDSFKGVEWQVQYFNHVISLTAHMIVKQFNVPKGEADSALATAVKALLKLAAGTNLEDAITSDPQGYTNPLWVTGTGTCRCGYCITMGTCMVS